MVEVPMSLRRPPAPAQSSTSTKQHQHKAAQHQQQNNSRAVHAGKRATLWGKKGNASGWGSGGRLEMRRGTVLPIRQ
jgi:hypothetical protein